MLLENKCTFSAQICSNRSLKVFPRRYIDLCIFSEKKVKEQIMLQLITNLIKSHFLAVNEIQRQNTVPSRSNSDMNYPHFYITFLFTFLIDVSSVSYYIHIYSSSYAFIYHEKSHIMAFIYYSKYYIISYLLFFVLSFFEYHLQFSVHF